MDSLIFSQTAVFRLQQLASQVYQATGVRHKLSDAKSVVRLLNDSGYSAKPNIKNHYEAFVLELNKRQIDALLAQGVNLRTPGVLGSRMSH